MLAVRRLALGPKGPKTQPRCVSVQFASLQPPGWTGPLVRGRDWAEVAKNVLSSSYSLRVRRWRTDLQCDMSNADRLRRRDWTCVSIERALYQMNLEKPNKRQPLQVMSVTKLDKPSHVGKARRLIVRASWLPTVIVDGIDRFGIALQKVANVLRFERFWTEKVANDPRVVVVPTFNKKIGKHPIWNVAINWINDNAPSGSVIEFGTNNGGWLKYFVDRLPSTIRLSGFDCFEGLPEAWDGLPAGSIKGFGAPVALWDDQPEIRQKIIDDAARGVAFPKPPQPNVKIESGLFSEALPRFLKDERLDDLRLVHFDADLYTSTRPVLDTICGRLKHRYLILFDEFYSVNHEFKAWYEFLALYKLTDWRVLATSADGSQVLIEVNTRASVDAA